MRGSLLSHAFFTVLLPSPSNLIDYEIAPLNSGQGFKPYAIVPRIRYVVRHLIVEDGVRYPLRECLAHQLLPIEMSAINTLRAQDRHGYNPPSLKAVLLAW